MDNHLEEKSRTRIKKEATELQHIGEKLTGLNHDQLTAMDMPFELKEAVTALRSITSNQARRRQIQYIGALMRKIDVEPILQALSLIDAGLSLRRKTESEIGQWAERLAAGDDAPFDVIMENHPQADRQKLRHLIRNARKAIDTPQAAKALKTLTGYIRDLGRI
ncbi:ribosome biogenesis factor YjgA [Desulfatiferula olefinivorans]